MKNSEFIDNYNFTPNKSHGNLFTDSNGTMYSYGYHYPLLFKVNGLTFVNTRGYSNTTSKHINYCRPYARYQVELYRDETGSYSIEYESVLYNLEEELKDINDDIAELKRHNTQKEARLLSERARVSNTIHDLLTSQK